MISHNRSLLYTVDFADRSPVSLSKREGVGQSQQAESPPWLFSQVLHIACILHMCARPVTSLSGPSLTLEICINLKSATAVAWRQSVLTAQSRSEFRPLPSVKHDFSKRYGRHDLIIYRSAERSCSWLCGRLGYFDGDGGRTCRNYDE